MIKRFSYLLSGILHRHLFMQFTICILISTEGYRTYRIMHLSKELFVDSIFDLTRIKTIAEIHTISNNFFY